MIRAHPRASAVKSGINSRVSRKSGEEEDKIIFKKDHFIQDCTNAVAEGQEAIREVVAKAVSDNAAVMTELGEPQHAGITPIHRSHTLTIINFVWAPCMSLMPHNHQMFSVVGI